MAKKITEVIFVYSEIMIREENVVLKTIGKQFIPGEVFIGTTSKKYTKMIVESEFEGIKLKYPDVKIIAKGDRYKLKYTQPTTDMAIQD
jgi:hypothetical protein